MGLLSYYNGKHSTSKKYIINVIKSIFNSERININNIVVIYFWYLNFVI